MKKRVLSAITSVVMAVGCFSGISATVIAEENSPTILEQGVAQNFTLGYNETVEFSYTIKEAGVKYISINSEKEKQFYDIELKANEELIKTLESNTGNHLYTLTADEDNIGKEIVFSFSNSDNNSWSEDDKPEMSICIMNYEFDDRGLTFLSFGFTLSPRTVMEFPFNIYGNSRVSIGFEDSAPTCYVKLFKADGSEDYGASLFEGEVNLTPGEYILRLAQSDNNCSEEHFELGIIYRTSTTQLGLGGKNTELDLYDAIEITKYIMGMVEFDDDQMFAADYDFNDVVDLYDVIAIARDLMR